MLPSNLLRAKISRGTISPLYASLDFDTMALAERISGIFRDATGKRRGELMDKLREVEGRIHGLPRWPSLTLPDDGAIWHINRKDPATDSRIRLLEDQGGDTREKQRQGIHLRGRWQGAEEHHPQRNGCTRWRGKTGSVRQHGGREVCQVIPLVRLWMDAEERARAPRRRHARPHP